MTTGIREFTTAQFAQHLPQLKELGNAGFRAKVMGETITKFGISVASAATHYNFSLKAQRQADPKSVEGLGRPEGKKGGRKPAQTVDVINIKTGEVVASGIAKSAAERLITAAEAKNKAKLAIKVDAPAAETAVVAEGAQAAETTATATAEFSQA